MEGIRRLVLYVLVLGVEVRVIGLVCENIRMTRDKVSAHFYQRYILSISGEQER